MWARVMKRGEGDDGWAAIGKVTPYICLLKPYEGETLPMICIRDERYTSPILATHPNFVRDLPRRSLAGTHIIICIMVL